jgi:putative PLP-dependent aminotransferase (TIGR04422 family)
MFFRDIFCVTPSYPIEIESIHHLLDMKNQYFLWPKPNCYTFLKSFFQWRSGQDVESRLQEMFPSGYPVIFSSGRAALSVALIMSRVSRHDLVGVFPYASHCVLDSMSRITTPLSGSTAKDAPLRVVYHQWGYVQETNLPPNSIEDCVDTLCEIGAKLFPGGGAFEIWSLPKVLGTTSGGVLWCRTKQSAYEAREVRDSRGGGLFPWFLRLLGMQFPQAHLFWEGIEPNLGVTSSWQNGEIILAVKKWQEIVNKRKSYLEKIWPYAVVGLRSSKNRLPSVVPVRANLSEDVIFNIGISSGLRVLNKINVHGVIHQERVMPVPVHQDVESSWLLKVIDILKKNNK